MKEDERGHGAVLQCAPVQVNLPPVQLADTLWHPWVQHVSSQRGQCHLNSSLAYQYGFTQMQQKMGETNPSGVIRPVEEKPMDSL